MLDSHCEVTADAERVEELLMSLNDAPQWYDGQPQKVTITYITDMPPYKWEVAWEDERESWSIELRTWAEVVEWMEHKRGEG